LDEVYLISARLKPHCERREQAKWGFCGCHFRGKKEIPDNGK
jgi:hypothetical protein